MKLKTLPKARGYYCVGDGDKKIYSTSEQQMATQLSKWKTLFHGSESCQVCGSQAINNIWETMNILIRC